MILNMVHDGGFIVGINEVKDLAGPAKFRLNDKAIAVELNMDRRGSE